MRNARSLMAVTHTHTHKLCKLEDKTSSAFFVTLKNCIKGKIDT